MGTRLVGLILVAVALAGTVVVQAAEVNVYSARKEALIKPLLDRFTERTGVTVNLVTGNADALLKRLETEGRNSPADVLLTVDAGRLHRAREAGVLQAVKSAELERSIPAAYRDPNGYWFGLSLRARTILYAKDRVDPAELKSYEDLSDPRWKNRICIRSSDNIYNQSLVAALIDIHGEAKAEQWARGLVANMARPPKGGDRDQIKAAAAGQCDIAIANTYYLAGMLRDEKDADQRRAAQKMGVFWPNQAGRGVHVNVSGAGITAAAKNRDQAVKLLEFLANEDSQAWYAQVNNEYPVRPGIAVSELLASWGSFKADDLNLAVLGKNNAAALRLMDRAGWK
ncbi:MAG: iron ABC transporter substrate-binding protein [Proteobacteria bacterium]|nr:MAG: iron ABC transporter substrate-binding protein [Pseudomonadota bacterium]